MGKKATSNMQKTENDFRADVIDRLGRIETKLDSDFRALHGNGHPGLIAKVSQLEGQIMLLQKKGNWIKDSLGWIVATALAILNVYFTYCK